MRRAPFPSTRPRVLLAALSLVPTMACGNGDDNRVAPPNADAGAKTDAASAPASRPDASASNATASPSSIASTATSFVRLAQWSPAIPTVDFCIAPAGSGAFVGPLTREAFGSDDGGGGLVFPNVSAYFATTARASDVRLVAGGAGDCATGLGEDAAGIALASGSYTTIAAVEDASSGNMRPLVLSDDHSAPPGVALRFINAYAGTVDVGSQAMGALFTGVPFGSASRPPADSGSARSFDKNGYVALGAVNADTIRIATATAASTTPDAGSTLASATALSIAAGADVTLALLPAPPSIGHEDAGDAGTTPGAELIECVDNAGTLGPSSNCFITP